MHPLGLAIVATLALTATPSVAAGNPAEQKKDLARIICKSEPVVGTRLKTMRRCATAAEWAETMRLDRMSIEHNQRQRSTAGDVGPQL